MEKMSAVKQLQTLSEDMSAWLKGSKEGNSYLWFFLSKYGEFLGCSMLGHHKTASVSKHMISGSQHLTCYCKIML